MQEKLQILFQITASCHINHDILWDNFYENEIKLYKIIYEVKGRVDNILSWTYIM